MHKQQKYICCVYPTNNKNRHLLGTIASTLAQYSAMYERMALYWSNFYCLSGKYSLNSIIVAYSLFFSDRCQDYKKIIYAANNILRFIQRVKTRISFVPIFESIVRRSSFVQCSLVSFITTSNSTSHPEHCAEYLLENIHE